jgi:hypothetical protein
VKQIERVIAVVALSCVTLVNTDVARAVHVYQYRHSGRGNASGVFPSGGKPDPAGHHDASKCTICVTLATAKAVPSDFTPQVRFITGPAEEPVSAKTSVVSVISLPSSPPRGPPSISL